MVMVVPIVDPAPKKIKRRLLKVVILTGAFGLTVIATLFIYGLTHIAFNESLYVKKGSLDYYLAIDSAIIKHFPLVQMVETETYYSSCGDGPKPPAEGIDYVSRAPEKELLDIIDPYLKAQGYKIEVESVPNRLWKYNYISTNSYFHFNFEAQKDSLVKIVAEETY